MIKLKTKIPKKSGVYFFRNSKGKIIYIGKAADLRNRLRSYFSKSAKDARVLNMLKAAGKVSWQETGSEIEALILESQLIKKYRPQFNILMRDDKSYFYVAFTKEEFPKIRITHQPSSRQSFAELLVGPLTDGTALKTTLKLLRKIFPYCTCKEKHNNYCLNYHLENCPGYCCLKKESRIKNQELRTYNKNIKAVRNILSGKRLSLAKQLEKEMNALAEKGDFEGAIKTRKQLASLNKIFENAKIISKPPEDSPQEVLKETQDAFGLVNLPRRIEAYDISNIQGTNAVGAMAVFTDGQPDKSEYRKFKIKYTRSGGDVTMLKEVLSRRLKHPEWPLPDLIIIDGGKAQLNAAVLTIPKSTSVIALTKNKKHRADHIFVAGNPKPLRLDFLTPDVRKLILWTNSEAHRFAISYYHRTHRKSAFT